MTFYFLNQNDEPSRLSYVLKFVCNHGFSKKSMDVSTEIPDFPFKTLIFVCKRTDFHNGGSHKSKGDVKELKWRKVSREQFKKNLFSFFSHRCNRAATIKILWKFSSLFYSRSISLKTYCGVQANFLTSHSGNEQLVTKGSKVRTLKIKIVTFEWGAIPWFIYSWSFLAKIY